MKIEVEDSTTNPGTLVIYWETGWQKVRTSRVNCTKDLFFWVSKFWVHNFHGFMFLGPILLSIFLGITKNAWTDIIYI